MRLSNVKIILSALVLNMFFFMILVFINKAPDLKDVQDKLRPIEVWQRQPKVPKITNRKKQKDKPFKKKKKKILRLKPVSLNQEKIKPRKIKRVLNIDIEPSLDVNDVDLAIQEDYSAALPDESKVLGLDEVDEPPRKIYHVKPAYPYFARVNRIEGYVTLQFLVNEDGNVSDVQALGFAGHEGFREAAIKAVMKWRFKPATYFGQPASVLCIQRISFKLEGVY